MLSKLITIIYICFLMMQWRAFYTNMKIAIIKKTFHKNRQSCDLKQLSRLLCITFNRHDIVIFFFLQLINER